MQSIVTNLWFDNQAEEAAEHYIAALGNGRIIRTVDYGPGQMGEEGTTMLVEFELRGQPFVGINGGPMFSFTEAVSLEVRCADQDEIDRVLRSYPELSDDDFVREHRDRWLTP